MQNVSAQMGQRPSSTTPLEDRQPPHWASWVLVIVAALAFGLALLYFYRAHSGRRVSAIDAAAIERVIAGKDISISPLGGIPNVSVDYYDVDATSPAAIRQELNAKGPLEDGRHFDANTRWDYRWTWGPAADGSCGTANADISFSAVIRLPHLTRFAALKPNVAQAWRAYMTALAFHEAGHVRNGYDGRESVASAVRSSSCSDANAAGDEVVKRLNEQDRRYDDLTRHGANDGAVFG